MDTMQFYVIQIGFLFEDNKNFWYLVVLLNNFLSMNNCPWVQGKSNKPPPPSRGVCVCGRENNYSMIYLYFYFHTHGYANDIILLYDYWMKGLVKLYYWWYNNMQHGQFGGRIQFIFAFL